jgi:hypothetical protein
MGSPLLERAGFYDPPFKMMAEKSVQIVLDDEDDEVETLKGRIDVLVMQNQFWVQANFKGGTRHVIYPWNQSKI